MADPFDKSQQGLPSSPPRTSPPPESPQARLLRQIREAERKAEQVACSEHRDQVRMELGAPRVPSRGNGDCLALVLLPVGLILMVVHPVPAITVLGVVGWLFLAGSDRQRSDRKAIEDADAEAERRWQQLRNRPLDQEAGWNPGAEDPPG